MKNFLRSLRFSFPYRTRLVISVIAALMAAALWSLNFTAIYPVLKILGSNVTLQTWVDQKIDSLQQQMDDPAIHAEIAATKALLRGLEVWPVGPIRERYERDWTNKLTRLEGKLKDTGRDLYHYQLLKAYFINYLPNNRFQTLAVLLGLVVLGVALKGVFEFIQESLVGSVTHKTLFDIRNRFYRKVIHHDLAQFGDSGSHELMARFTNDLELVANGVKILYGKVIAEPLRALGCVIVACWFSWQLTVTFLILVPAALIVLHKVSRLMKRATRRLLEGMSAIYRILGETFKGIAIVKGFTMEHAQRRKFRQATQTYYKQAMKVVNIDAAASPIVELLGIAAVAGSLLIGAYLVLEQKTHIFGLRMSEKPLEMETLLQIYALLAAIADPVRRLSSVYTKLQSAAAASDRVFAIMDRQPTIQRNLTGPKLRRLATEIEFRDVCFCYEPGKNVVYGVNLTVRAGETIAVVGRNGSGKTTLLGMLSRFHDPQNGSIFFDGIDIRSANLRTLRRQIALVTQEPFLFDDTVWNNIAMGNPEATPAQIEAAAGKAKVTDFLDKLQNGFETIVGEAGNKLSGGQRQRIALARAIVRDPAVLILDEFTSQVDAESEAAIHQALREFVKGRTTFVITHRLHTLEIADRIVVMDAGRIVAVGKHLELLAMCPTYQRLHEAHFQRRVA